MTIYPVVVTLPDGTQRTGCKVQVLVDQSTDVWVWNRETHAAEILVHTPARPVEAAGTGRTQRWTLDVDGASYSLERNSRDCGCGHPMKRFRPPTDGAVRAMADPR